MGVGEWSGPWSDGSKEWTPYWMQKLNYRFGDDGEFWMSYDAVLRYFQTLDRTRLFDKEWTIVQQWTSVNISWVTGYLNTKFLVEIKKPGPVIFVLSQVRQSPLYALGSKRLPAANISTLRSSTPATSSASKANITLNFIFFCSEKMPLRVST
jgi:hypothetical protein